MAESSEISHDFPRKLKRPNEIVAFFKHFVKIVAPSQLNSELNLCWSVLFNMMVIASNAVLLSAPKWASSLRLFIFFFNKFSNPPPPPPSYF